MYGPFERCYKVIMVGDCEICCNEESERNLASQFKACYVKSPVNITVGYEYYKQTRSYYKTNRFASDATVQSKYRYLIWPFMHGGVEGLYFDIMLTFLVFHYLSGTWKNNSSTLKIVCNIDLVFLCVEIWYNKVLTLTPIRCDRKLKTVIFNFIIQNNCLDTTLGFF